MLPLDSPRWAELSHAFGSAEETPTFIQALIDCLDDPTWNAQRYQAALSQVDSEMEKMFHQCCVSDVAGFAIPHLLRLTSRLNPADQLMMYHCIGWMDMEGAQPNSDPEQKWYKDAIEHARAEITGLAQRADTNFDFDQQRSLFFGVSCLFGLQTMFFIRDDYHDFACAECDQAMTYSVKTDGCYERENPELPTGQGSFLSDIDIDRILQRKENSDIKFLRQLAVRGMHQEFSNWFAAIVAPFSCPNCGNETDLYRAV